MAVAYRPRTMRLYPNKTEMCLKITTGVGQSTTKRSIKSATIKIGQRIYNNQRVYLRNWPSLKIFQFRRSYRDDLMPYKMYSAECTPG